MFELSPQAQVRLQQMRDNYRQALPLKKNELEASWAQCRKTGWSGASVAELKSLAHKLAGSAGLFGLDDLGAAAKALDRGLPISAVPLINADVQQVLALMVQLESQFNVALSQ